MVSSFILVGWENSLALSLVAHSALWLEDVRNERSQCRWNVRAAVTVTATAMTTASTANANVTVRNRASCAGVYPHCKKCIHA